MTQKYWIRMCKLEFYNQQGELKHVYWGRSCGIGQNLDYKARVIFNIVKTNDAALQTSTIKLFNLNKEGSFYQTLLEERMNVRLFAGYKRDFENGTAGQIPIYSGRIYQKPKTIYNGQISETTLYCYFGVLIKKIKVPGFSLKGAVTTKILFSHLRDKIKKLDIGLNFPEDTDILANLGSAIFNKTIAQLGYSIPVSRTLDEFLTSIARVLSDRENEVQWYLDDAKKQIIFYNINVKGRSQNTLVLEQGRNILSFDENALLQYERKEYLANMTGKYNPIKKESKKRGTYNVSTFIQPDVYLDTKIQLKNFEAPDNISISKMKYFGDTHGDNNEWRIDLELYERG